MCVLLMSCNQEHVDGGPGPFRFALLPGQLFQSAGGHLSAAKSIARHHRRSGRLTGRAARLAYPARKASSGESCNLECGNSLPLLLRFGRLSQVVASRLARARRRPGFLKSVENLLLRIVTAEDRRMVRIFGRENCDHGYLPTAQHVEHCRHFGRAV